jgi:hypothetical protein
MGQGNSTIPTQEVVARCLDPDHVAKKYASAALRTGVAVERLDFAEEMEFATDVDFTISDLLSNHFEMAINRDAVYPVKASRLLLASSSQSEQRPEYRPTQWVDTAAPATVGQLPPALLLSLVRASYKVDEALFDQIMAHPLLRVVVNATPAAVDASKGKEEASEKEKSPQQPQPPNRSEQLAALEQCASESEKLSVCAFWLSNPVSKNRLPLPTLTKWSQAAQCTH